MTYTFRCRATGQVVMKRDVGDRLLLIVGKEIKPRGIFRTSEIPRAIQALESAALDEIAHPTPVKIGQSCTGQYMEDANDVTLRQQVWPLIQMMKRAISENRSIDWEV